MELKKLHFFDKSGYDLNFDFNEIRNCWEGNVYLPKVSLGLYSNTTIYVLEEVGDEFVFPRKSSNDKGYDKILCQWDITNNFVDEIFMFTFDDEYLPNKHSSLEWVVNEGPDCIPLLVTKFDRYEIPLEEKNSKNNRVLPIHIAFSSPAKYDENTFKRTLILQYGFEQIARINIFAESVEEDERLKIWNSNLGYHITEDDMVIFRDSDIKEPLPDYMMLNEKRKELMMEGHTIYPYIGSYKALLGIVKFFGYDNINFIEFWKNINPSDPDFGKVVMSPRYVLSNRECTYVKNKYINVPNKDYRKANKLALTYTITTPTDEVDLFELPIVKEEFQFTIEEILIKLFALRKKLNKEFMPANSRIIDIIGEVSYFGIQLWENNFTFCFMDDEIDKNMDIDIECWPSKIIHITDDDFFNDFILEEMNNGRNENETIEGDSIINNVRDLTISDIEEMNVTKKGKNVNNYNLNDSKKCELYRKYYEKLNYTFTKTEDVIDNDTYVKPNEQPTISPDKLNEEISAKVILSLYTVLNDQSFNSSSTFDDDNIIDDTYTNVKWTISLSEDQTIRNERMRYYDEVKSRYEETNDKSLKEILDKMKEIEEDEGIFEPPVKSFSLTKNGNPKELSEVFFELPYVGYYDVTVELTKNITVTKYNTASKSYTTTQKTITDERTFDKYIKVEPYNIDIRGFYYDKREKPQDNHRKYEQDDMDDQIDMESYILRILDILTFIGMNDNYTSEYSGEKVSKLIYDYNGVGGYDYKMVRKRYQNVYDYRSLPVIPRGPYHQNNFELGEYFINDGLIMIDNVNSDIVNLIPKLETARYIRNGVDVKPYTWIFLTFDNSRIVKRCNPKWTLKNLSTGKNYEYDGKYFTCLLRDEGYYTISLDLEDVYGNKYNIDRNVIIVDENSNSDLYTPFKNDYDAYMSYEDYKKQISLSEFLRLGTSIIEEPDENDFYFNNTDIKLFNSSNSIIGFTSYDFGSDDEITLDKNTGIGWNYPATMSFDNLKSIDISMSSSDNMYLYVFDENGNKFSRKLTNSSKITIDEMKTIETSNVSKVVLMNNGETLKITNLNIQTT